MDKYRLIGTEGAMQRYRMAIWMTLIAIGAVVLIVALVPGPWR